MTAALRRAGLTLRRRRREQWERVSKRVPRRATAKQMAGRLQQPRRIDRISV